MLPQKQTVVAEVCKEIYTKKGLKKKDGGKKGHRRKNNPTEIKGNAEREKEKKRKRSSVSCTNLCWIKEWKPGLLSHIVPEFSCANECADVLKSDKGSIRSHTEDYII